MSVLGERLAGAFAGRKVLELGGGGEWTSAYAGRAAEVTVQAAGDALPDFGRRHDALFAPYRWSRVSPERLDDFLKEAVHAAAPGALIAFLDRRAGDAAPSASELIARASRCGGWGANVELLPDHWLLTWWAAR
jgi:hypothetical protein